MATSPLPPADTAPILAQLQAAAGFERLKVLAGDGLDPDMVAAVLAEAARFADGWLSDFNIAADRAGCRIEDGRVKTAPGHKAAWDAYREAGWMGLDQPEAIGGQALPVSVLAACTEVFDRSSVAFGMAPTGQRAACRLLDAHADAAIKAEWLPRLISGEWAATIVISEPEAGSDVGRIRSMARPRPDGEWRSPARRSGYPMATTTWPRGSATASWPARPTPPRARRVSACSWSPRCWTTAAATPSPCGGSRRNWACTPRPPAPWVSRARGGG